MFLHSLSIIAKGIFSRFVYDNIAIADGTGTNIGSLRERKVDGREELSYCFGFFSNILLLEVRDK